jgi:hypothetical protein
VLKAQNVMSLEGRQSVADWAFALSCVGADELRANSVQKTDFALSWKEAAFQASRLWRLN